MLCYVYHIARESSLGDLSEGYIGVSCNPSYRWMRHIRYEKNSRVKRAYKKYGDVEMRIISSGPREFCMALESMLRPEPRMGWNLAPGGGDPPSHKGLSRSKEQKARLKSSRQEFVWTIGGEEFSTQQEAADKLKLSRTTIRARIEDENFPDWYKTRRNSRKMRRDPTFDRSDW